MPYYITVPLPPWHHQMSLEELFDDMYSSPRVKFNPNESNTKTYEVNHVSYHFRKKASPNYLLTLLREFNTKYEKLRGVKRDELYHTFYIAKHSGGLRRIDEPLPELMEALRELKHLFENQFGALHLYHTSSFAYAKKRSTVKAMKRHQDNESKWFAKYDLSNFFGSTTLEFVMNMFSKIFPFCEVCKIFGGSYELKKALELCFWDNRLPQGTPMSPMITNIMMIPIDFKLCNQLRNYEKQKYVYTRYADDFQISSRYDFDVKKIENLIVSILKSEGAPFSINSKKTRYGSSSGRNWNLGIMINAENKMTVGYKKKKQFQAMLFSYIKDRQNGKPWQLNDLQILEGYRNYYKSVEGDSFDKVVQHIADKFNVDVVKMIKDDIRNASQGKHYRYS